MTETLGRLIELHELRGDPEAERYREILDRCPWDDGV